MEKRKRGNNGCSVLFMVLLSFGAPAICAPTVDDQKNYYITPIPNHSSHSSPACPTPSHGDGGGHGPTVTPVAPSHGSGGHTTPETPSHGSGGQTTPAIPSHGSGGHTTPAGPSHGSSGSHSYPSPSTGGGSTPAAPTITVPSPLVPYDPNVPPFHPGNCSYWISHPGRIVAVVGYVGTIGDFFGAGCVFAVGGRNPTLHDAVASTFTGGVGDLLRQGTAALLNSLSCTNFPFTSQQVRSALAAAVSSEGAAAAQAAVFKQANEDRYKT